MIPMERISMGDRSFYVFRTYKERENKPVDADLLKEFWHCDTVLKKENVYHFCREIQDAEYEMIPEPTPDETVPEVHSNLD
jgi:hypothetical protein